MTAHRTTETEFKSEKGKNPAFQFYPGDWMKDPELRSCSIAARGLWMECLCLMFESQTRGVLRLKNGTIVTEKHLARMTGCTPREAGKHLGELLEMGVAQRAEDGAIYSKRMMADEEKRQNYARNGQLGGRPTVTQPAVAETKPVSEPKPNANQTHNQTETKPVTKVEPNTEPNPNQNDPSSSSSSSTSSSSEFKTLLPPVVAEGKPPPEVVKDTTAKKPGKPAKPKAEPKIRERNTLFDAIADVCGLDPSISGSLIGSVSTDLGNADVPYTAADVHEFARRFWEFCAWAKKDGRTRPSPTELRKYISQIRATPATPDVPINPNAPKQFMTKGEAETDYFYRMGAAVAASIERDEANEQANRTGPRVAEIDSPTDGRPAIGSGT